MPAAKVNSCFLLSQCMLYLSRSQLFPPTPCAPLETTLHQLAPFFIVCLQPFLPINSYTCSGLSRMPPLEPIFLSLLPSTSSIPPSPLPTSQYSSTHFMGLKPPAFHKNHQRNLAASDVSSRNTPLPDSRIPPSWVFSQTLLMPSQPSFALFCPSPKSFYLKRFLLSGFSLLSLLHSP